MYLDPNDEYAFVLQWISESNEAMLPRIKQSARNLMMYQHKPSRNSYKEQARKFDLHKARNLGLSDLEFERYKSVVDTIPDGRSDIVFRSIETNVSQLSGGIGQLKQFYWTSQLFWITILNRFCHWLMNKFTIIT